MSIDDDALPPAARRSLLGRVNVPIRTLVLSAPGMATVLLSRNR